MRVSLVDVDGHNFPNLALMKLAAWHKANGDSVEWYQPLFSRPDRIYASKVFTFTPDYFDYAPCDPDPVKGGTGYDFKSKLPDEVDACLPDYSIYPQYDFAIGFLSRGCIRNCPWCVVPRKEGWIRQYDDIERVAQGRKNVVLMDNNFLANEEDFVREQLEKAKRMKVRIDFNQALDARLVTPKNAKWLASARWMKYIRFACDYPGEINPVREAVRMLTDAGYRREFFVYFLAKDAKETLQRINSVLEGMTATVTPFVMPYRNLDSGGGMDIGDDVRDLARWCNRQAIRKSCSFEKYKRGSNGR